MVKRKRSCITLTFLRKNIRKDVLEKIEDSHWGMGLYALEKIFKKECDGHGAGKYGEDIFFTIYGKDIEVTWDEKRLEIGQTVYKNDRYDLEDIDPKVIAYLLRKLGK